LETEDIKNCFSLKSSLMTSLLENLKLNNWLPNYRTVKTV